MIEVVYPLVALLYHMQKEDKGRVIAKGAVPKYSPEIQALQQIFMEKGLRGVVEYSRSLSEQVQNGNHLIRGGGKLKEVMMR